MCHHEGDHHHRYHHEGDHHHRHHHKGDQDSDGNFLPFDDPEPGDSLFKIITRVAHHEGDHHEGGHHEGGHHEGDHHEGSNDMGSMNLVKRQAIFPQEFYNGGPVMTEEPTIYYIYYGDWTRNRRTRDLLEDFASDIGRSEWYDILTTYYERRRGSRIYVEDGANFGYSVHSRSNFGTTPSDGNIRDIVKNAIRDGQVPLDRNAVYFVLTAPGIVQTGVPPNGGGGAYCSGPNSYCGWHYWFRFRGRTLKMAFVGAPSRCSSCFYVSSNPALLPNRDVNADNMVTAIAHELAETITDPLGGSGWYTQSTLNHDGEIGDACNGNFVTSRTTPSGAQWNIRVGNRRWNVQGLQIGGAGPCVLHT